MCDGFNPSNRRTSKDFVGLLGKLAQLARGQDGIVPHKNHARKGPRLSQKMGPVEVFRTRNLFRGREVGLAATSWIETKWFWTTISGELLSKSFETKRGPPGSSAAHQRCSRSQQDATATLPRRFPLRQSCRPHATHGSYRPAVGARLQHRSHILGDYQLLFGHPIAAGPAPISNGICKVMREPQPVNCALVHVFTGNTANSGTGIIETGPLPPPEQKS